MKQTLLHCHTAMGLILLLLSIALTYGLLLHLIGKKQMLYVLQQSGILSIILDNRSLKHYT